MAWLLLAIIASAIVAEFLVEPGTDKAPRPRQMIGSVAVALAAVLVLFALTGRPVSSTVAAGVLMIAVVLVSNAKVAVLKEPLAAVDFAMVEQVFRHPQLFLPYLGRWPALAIIAAIAAGSWAAFSLEAPDWPVLDDGWATLVLLIAVVVATVLALRAARPRLASWARTLNPSFDSVADTRRFGLFGNLVVTALLLCDQAGKAAMRQHRRRTLARPAAGALPDIVAVQAESFFDVRRMDPLIGRELLQAFDACQDEAVVCGRLAVPCWGAYTQRTEFAFLTGIAGGSLGVDRLNPYLRFARSPVWSIAHELRALGYQTICIHPFAGTFFGRHLVMPNLGFETFLDVGDFQGAERFGPYVSDGAVAEKILRRLERPGPPRFIFAITMENHGQWRSDRLPAEEVAKVRNLAPGLPGEFLCYLRHVANCDAMIGRLAQALRQRGRSVFCLFGDHVPSFPKLFDERGFTDPSTDYFIWHSEVTRGNRYDADVSALSDLLLAAAELEPSRADPAAARPAPAAWSPQSRLSPPLGAASPQDTHGRSA